MNLKFYTAAVLLTALLLTGCRPRTTAPLPTETVTGTRTQFFDSAKTQAGNLLLDMVSAKSWTCALISPTGKTIQIFPYSLIKPLADGTYLARNDSFLVKLDSAQHIIWQTRVSGEPHHEITTDEQGNIYTFGCDVRPFMGLQVKFDEVLVYSPSGKLLKRWSVYDHLAQFVAVIAQSKWTAHLPVKYKGIQHLSEYISQSPADFIFPTTANCDAAFEFTHFNAMQVLPQNKLAAQLPAFKKGNLLISFHPYAACGILNLNTGNIEWVQYLHDRTKLHSSSLTEQGTLLVFQNATDSLTWLSKQGYDTLIAQFLKVFPNAGKAPVGNSRNWASVAEYNPLTQQVIWEYTASPKDSMRATSRGSAQRLPNGNTLICATTETAGGKVLEVTSEGQIVWQYIPSIDTTTGKPWAFYRAKKQW
jgi:hypothetical protein